MPAKAAIKKRTLVLYMLLVGTKYFQAAEVVGR